MSMFTYITQSLIMESILFVSGDLGLVDCWDFAFSWGCNFIDASVFSFSKKKSLSEMVFVENVNCWVGLPTTTTKSEQP